MVRDLLTWVVCLMSYLLASSMVCGQVGVHRTDNAYYPERHDPVACEPVEGHDEAKSKVPLMRFC